MFTYILRRILSSIPVLFGILAVTFILARAIPGDPCRAMLGEKATQAVCDQFIHRHGLDKPILTQFGIYVTEIARGDFGESLRYGKASDNFDERALADHTGADLCSHGFQYFCGHPAGDHLSGTAEFL